MPDGSPFTTRDYLARCLVETGEGTWRLDLLPKAGASHLDCSLLADGFSMGTSNVLSIRSSVTTANRPSIGKASRNGFATFAAFVVSGLLPLSAYLLPVAEDVRFPAACILAATALFGIGACRSLFSDRPWLIAGLEMLALGAIASIVAYGVGAMAAALINGSAHS